MMNKVVYKSFVWCPATSNGCGSQSVYKPYSLAVRTPLVSNHRRTVSRCAADRQSAAETWTTHTSRLHRQPTSIMRTLNGSRITAISASARSDVRQRTIAGTWTFLQFAIHHIGWFRPFSIVFRTSIKISLLLLQWKIGVLPFRLIPY